MTGTKLKTKAEPPPENRRLGYARVSTYGQTLDAQLEQLRAERCGRIYRENGCAGDFIAATRRGRIVEGYVARLRAGFDH